MDKQDVGRCPHFQLYAQPLDIDNGPNMLAIRRCMLTERLIGLLEQTPNGSLLTQRLTIRIDAERAFAIVGPDLEAVTQTACTVNRCEERCTPSYVGHLEHFGGTDPHIEEVTCREQPDEQARAAASDAVSATSTRK
jgi:hypothetical protein